MALDASRHRVDGADRDRRGVAAFAPAGEPAGYAHGSTPFVRPSSTRSPPAMTATLPLLILSALSIVVVSIWASAQRGRRAIGIGWGLALAVTLALGLARGGDDPIGRGAIALAFAVSLAGLFMPQIARLMSRERR
jgi:hypothetical protein